jgi:hypothetical protein
MQLSPLQRVNFRGAGHRNDLIEKAFEGQTAGYSRALSPMGRKSSLTSKVSPNVKPDRAIVPPDGSN